MSFCLYAIYQRTQSESKSQLTVGSAAIVSLCMQSIKEHNLKANHNIMRELRKRPLSVCNLSKNTIWKQITTSSLRVIDSAVCMQSIKEHNLKANHNSPWVFQNSSISVCNLSKNTIWKQITTGGVYPHLWHCLYAIYQRTQSESKSQR